MMSLAELSKEQIDQSPAATAALAQRNKKLAALLRQWLEDADNDNTDEWEILSRELAADRVSFERGHEETLAG
jgi:alkylhydroperoxidase family enzyme